MPTSRRSSRSVDECFIDEKYNLYFYLGIFLWFLEIDILNNTYIAFIQKLSFIQNLPDSLKKYRIMKFNE